MDIPFPDLNRAEWLCCALALGMQAALLAWRGERLRSILIAVAAMAPACCIAAAAATRLLTCDDSWIYPEIVNFRHTVQGNWDLGALRTTLAVLGPAMSVLTAVTHWTADMALMAAKALHWLLGIFIITILVDQLHRYCCRAAPRVLFHAFLLSSILLLPVVNLAIKTLNYDLVSMTLGALAALWLCAGLGVGSTRLLLCSVGAAVLAAQEKLIASPLLWLCIIAAAVRMTWPARRAGTAQLFARAAAASAAATCVALALILVTYGLAIIAHGPGGPSFDVKVLFPFLQAVWPLVRILAGSPACSYWGALPTLGPAWIAPGIAGIWAVVFIADVALCRLFPPAAAAPPKQASGVPLARILAYLKFSLLCLAAIAGGISTLALHATVWPLVPAPPGGYVPRATFNGISLCYGAHSFLTHCASSVAWAFATFANAIPSALLAVIVFFSGLRLRKNMLSVNFSRMDAARDTGAVVLVSGIVLYGLFQIPLLPRYLNLPFLGILIFCLPDLFALRLPNRVTGAIAAAVVLLTALEELPFLPSAVTFHPVWSVGSKQFNKSPNYGRTGPWCTGWGEEVLQAGKRIHALSGARECAERGMVRIFHNYPGGWVQMPSGVSLFFMDCTFTDYRYEPCDYYLLSRAGTTFSPHPFPYGIRPLMTLDERGFVKAWVFRASDLAAAGFRFEEVRRTQGTLK